MRQWIAVMLVVVALAGTGCAKKGAMEQAGEDIDHALSDANRELNKTFGQ